MGVKIENFTDDYNNEPAISITKPECRLYDLGDVYIHLRV
jgi:hypothetical protein